MLYFINYFVIFSDLTLQTADVNKYIFSAVVRSDESETFCFVEEFYCTFLHCVFVFDIDKKIFILF